MQNITIFVLVFILLAGCCVEKRHYRKGYSINWFSHSHNPCVVKPNEPIEKENAVVASSSHLPVILKNEAPETNQQSTAPQKKLPVKHKLKLGFKMPQLFVKQEKIELSGQNQEVRIVPTVAWVSFGSTILSFIIFFIAPGLSILLALLACILGSIALYKIKHHPAIYKGRGYALTGILFFVLLMIALIVLIFVEIASLSQ